MYKMSYICLINSHIKLDSSLNLGRVQTKKKMYSFQKNITTINSNSNSTFIVLNLHLLTHPEVHNADHNH